MKNFIKLLMIISVMVFTGINNANAQDNIYIHWDASCPDTCTSQQVCGYFVEATVINYCVHPPEVQCYDSKWISCSELGTYLSYDCEDVTSNPCYYIRANVTKFCSWPGNQIVKCTGSGSTYKSCPELMAGVDIPIEWDE